MGDSAVFWKKINPLIFFIVLVFGKASASDQYTMGVDYLYWQPLNTSLDYAVVGIRETVAEAFELHTKYLPVGQDDGARFYIHAPHFFQNCDAEFSYTQYGTKTKRKIKTGRSGGIILSTPLPNIALEEFGSDAAGNWRMEYKSFESFLSRSLMDPILWKITILAGLKGSSWQQKRSDLLEELLSGVDNGYIYFKRFIKIGGIGPLLGLNIHYKLLPQLKIFGTFKGAVLVGAQTNIDHLTFNSRIQTLSQDFEFKNKGLWFTNFHGIYGIKYETSICDLQFGWEVINWTPLYSQTGFKIRHRQNAQAFQGIFAGLQLKL